MKRLRRRGIVCLVTDRRVMPLETIRAAIVGGVDLIQVRERDLDAAALCDFARGIVTLARATDTLVVVNDRLDVALASGADGVHLRGDSFPAARARLLSPPGFLVGRSIHTEREARSAEADYVVFGTVFASAGKPPGHTVAGVEGLRAACAACPVPVLAIGGVSVDRAPALAAAGASGVAGIGVFASAADLAEAVRRLSAAFRKPVAGLAGRTTDSPGGADEKIEI